MVYAAENYQITFFVPEKRAKILQAFIGNCTLRGFQYGVTPFGLTSVKTCKSKSKELRGLFNQFFEDIPKQETIEIFPNTPNAQFLSYNHLFEVDIQPYVDSGRKLDLETVKPFELFHCLYLDSEMTWDFMTQVLSLPKSLGKQCFSHGLVVSLFNLDIYFSKLTQITNHLGKHGFFQVLYKDISNNIAVSKAYYEEGEIIKVQPVLQRHIPTPRNYVAVKLMWYDYKYE